MQLTIPTLADRTYQQLLDEALARIPVHTPEWTNFNPSDPGVTLLQLFAFLTENLLYRSNQIPERNRRKFLSLLGRPLQPASSARGLVVFANERGPLQTETLNTDMEVRAGQVPFRTTLGLDVLPIEAPIFYKHSLEAPSEQLRAYYNQLYASFLLPPLSATAQLYETLLFPTPGVPDIDLGQDTIDGALWIALLVRAADKPAGNTATAWEALKASVRQQIGGKTLSLGVVPALDEVQRQLAPGGQSSPADALLLEFAMPIGDTLSTDPSQRVPRYRRLEAVSPTNVLAQPGIVQITLPAAAELKLWDNLDPLEAGVLDFPPPLEDTLLNDRVLTWIRVRATATARAGLLWAGINCAGVSQRAHVANEPLPPGTGEPDQVVILSKTPVLLASVRLTVTTQEAVEVWQEIDDLTSAGPEVPVLDPRQPPGTPPPAGGLVKVFALNPEAGEIRFGDGQRGARPPFGAVLQASYDYGVGRDGNVNTGAINSGPALPAGFKVTNPVATWGGAAAESVSAGEKQIALYLQHRDRLVNVADFEIIARRTPGVDIGRVDVLPAFNPELGGNDPGDAPGAVTLLVIPRYDPLHPDTPEPDKPFIDAICDYIDARRLVTTEVFIRGPIYKPLWISAGISVVAGYSIAEVREAVRQALLQFLSSLPSAPDAILNLQVASSIAPSGAETSRGWPLRKPVMGLELMAVASRTPGVLLVSGVLVAEGLLGEPQPVIDMRGLQLPRVAGIAVAVGEPLDVGQLRGTVPVTGGTGEPGGTDVTPQMVPVPVIPDECK